MIVLDASAILKYVVREVGWVEVERLIARGCATLHLAIYEVLASLELGARRGAIDRSLALASAKALAELLSEGLVELLEDWRFAPRALEIAMGRRVPVAEAMYVAAAEEIGTLATCVRRQAALAKELGIEAILIP